MEVHHHPQVEKKRFKEYFFEFLMIFIAVTLGFFAERYREHLVDRSKEREYMSQMVGDLGEDMRECGINNDRSILAINSAIRSYCDTLINILSEKNPTRDRIITAYFMYHRVMLDWFVAYFKDATWSQLRNSGGFSNIRHPDVVREINDYYKWTSIINDYKDEIKGKYYAINDNEGRKVFDQRMERIMLDSIESKKYSIMFDRSDSITKYVSDTVNIHLVHNDEETILRLCNDLRTYKSILVLYGGYITRQGNRAEKLVQLIKKEYNIQ